MAIVMRLWTIIKEKAAQFLFPNRVRVIKRYSLRNKGRDEMTHRPETSPESIGDGMQAAPMMKEKGTADEADILLESLAIRLQRDIRFDLPFEVTIVVPRAEITKKYQDGNLVETNLVYSGVTIAHSPKYPPRKR